MRDDDLEAVGLVEPLPELRQPVVGCRDLVQGFGFRVSGSVAPRVDRNTQVSSGGASSISTGVSKRVYWPHPICVIKLFVPGTSCLDMNSQLQVLVEPLTELGQPVVGCRHLVYRGTSLIRKRTPLGPYSRPMPRFLGGS